MIRLFAALAIPSEIADGLTRRQTGLREARWRTADSLHITLGFAGEVDEATAADIDAELLRVEGAPLTLRLEGVGAFGEGRDIHAVWAGVAESPALAGLAGRCERAMRRAGAPVPRRAYRAHVTLAYLRRPDPQSVERWLQAHSLLRSPDFEAAAFGLYSSWGSTAGSQYRLECVYPLRDRAFGAGP
jgi:2'-5' RNA ligase